MSDLNSNDATEESDKDATLYHYCSNEAFLGILSSGSIRLSDLRLSNDLREGQLVRERISALAASNQLPGYASEHLAAAIQDVQDEYQGFGFCLSTEGDLLSQWRGYADDSAGVCIGFSKLFLRDLASKDVHVTDGISVRKLTILQKVVYDEEAQLELLRPAYLGIEELINRMLNDKDVLQETFKRAMRSRPYEPVVSQAIKSSSEAIKDLFRNFYSIKGDAFSEEKEWRLLCTQQIDAATDIKFRPTKDRLIPFRSISFDATDSIRPITEVILGPRNITPCRVVSSVCEMHGYPDVSICKSRASYR